MSLTLRDAQHVCWKNFRKINDKLDQVRGKRWTPFVMVTDLLEEAGEVAAVVKGLEGFKPPEKPKTKEMLATELSDLLYIIFVLAEHYGLNLEETFLQTVNDYILRFIGHQIYTLTTTFLEATLSQVLYFHEIIQRFPCGCSSEAAH